jgi:ribonuclease VapC
MFIDASAIVAVIDRERGHEEIVSRMKAATGTFFVSALVRFEATIALARKKAAADKRKRRPSAELIMKSRDAINEFIREMAAEDIPITGDIGVAAIDASALYGKAAGHPAALNFGDCFSYACTKALDVGLIYKGDDFSKTDLA